MPSHRTCGDCSICCKLLPVNSAGLIDQDKRRVEVRKVAGERCRFQKHGKGCGVYSARPLVCELWTCRWLNGEGTEALSRPDRSHYVVDIMTTKIVLDHVSGGSSTTLTALQVWVDPKHPDVHRDPALRDYIQAQNMPAIVRYNSTKGFVIFPPGIVGPDWVEKESNIHPTQESFNKVLREAQA